MNRFPWPALLLALAACSKSSGSGDPALPPPSTCSPAYGSVLSGNTGCSAELTPTLMSLGAPAGKSDDDPSLIRAQDGHFYLVFISDRSGNMDLWITHSADGVSWASPIQVTTDTQEDFYPTLIQSADANFHLVWQRFDAAGTGQSHVYYRTTANPLVWGATETPVTTGAVDDWDCTTILIAPSELRTWFSSTVRGATGNREIYVVRSTNLGVTWGAPASAGVGSATEFDRYPAVVMSAASSFTMTWQRQMTDNIIDNSADLWTSTSTDGLAWTAPAQLTSDLGDTQPDLFANWYYAPKYGDWICSWTSTALAAGGGIVNQGLSHVTHYPSYAIDLSALMHNVGGWSTRTAAFPSGMSLVVFVNSSTGKPQLYSLIVPL